MLRKIWKPSYTMPERDPRNKQAMRSTHLKRNQNWNSLLLKEEARCKRMVRDGTISMIGKIANKDSR